MTNSLVVAQQNYNEIKWRQQNLSENGTKARVQQGASCRNSITAYSSQKPQTKCVLWQPCMLIWELSSLIHIPSIHILNDLGQTQEIQMTQGAFKQFPGYCWWKRRGLWYWGILVDIFFHCSDNTQGNSAFASRNLSWHQINVTTHSSAMCSIWWY